ncbi:MAG: ABC transporter permease [Clostridia bacterium]|nr:ABC transporter permease [Clostridia bacterium]
MIYFAKRNLKEIIRDPLTVLFGLGFPVVILLLLTAIQSNIPVSMFELSHLTPGIAVFGLSFMTLFSATLISRDRETAFLQRLFTTPLTAADFILGYTLPILPLSVLQCVITFIVAIILGLKITIGILYCTVFIIPVSIFYIALGLLCGSLLSVKQTGGICGALLTNLSAWFSGIWFDINLIGGVFKKIANALPFIHAVELERAVLKGELLSALPHLIIVLIYATAILCLAVFSFLRKMKQA